MPLAKRFELEHVILGIVDKFGPCTPYAVRQHFEVSPSAFFSSSTGSIYPAMRRLRETGWLDEHPDSRGRQKRVLYSITPEGREALRRWLAPPLDPEVVSVPYDALRTRVYFLAALVPAERLALIDHALAALERELSGVREYVDSYPAEGATRLSHLAARGALHEARARIRWLKELRNELETQDRRSTR